MSDREKVICHLNDCMEEARPDNTWVLVRTDIVEDVITLLKELEPIAPSVCGSKEPDGHGSWRYLCGECKKPIDYKDRACKRCGRLVKWE